MKTIIQAMLEEIYEKSIKISHGNKQAIHINSNLFFDIFSPQIIRKIIIL